MSEHIEKEISTNIFYQMPKFLFDKEYIDISNDSKVLYTLLRDRHDLSKQNKWIDKQGKVFLIYSQENMGEMLSRTVKTIRKSMKELRDYKLIEEVRQGLNKPNLIYILDVKAPISKVETGQVNFTYQKGYKVPTNDTKYNKTEKNYIHLQSVEDDYISFYLKTFRRYLGKEHMRVKETDLWTIEDAINKIKNYDVEIEEWQEEVENHFNSLPKTNNGNILAFIKASRRYFDVELER